MKNYMLVIFVVLVAVWTVQIAVSADKKEPEAKPKAEQKKQTKKRFVKKDPKSQRIYITTQMLEEIKAKQDALEKRERQLEEREQAIEVQEKILQHKLKRIEEVSNKVAQRLDQFEAQSEVRVNRLVSVIEGMKPAAAAKFLESVNPHLAVKVLSKLDLKRASKIMNNVSDEKSARLSELFTGYNSPPEKKRVKANDNEGNRS